MYKNAPKIVDMRWSKSENLVAHITSSGYELVFFSPINNLNRAFCEDGLILKEVEKKNQTIIPGKNF